MARKIDVDPLDELIIEALVKDPGTTLVQLAENLTKPDGSHVSINAMSIRVRNLFYKGILKTKNIYTYSEKGYDKKMMVSFQVFDASKAHLKSLHAFYTNYSLDGIIVGSDSYGNFTVSVGLFYKEESEIHKVIKAFSELFKSRYTNLQLCWNIMEVEA